MYAAILFLWQLCVLELLPVISIAIIRVKKKIIRGLDAFLAGVKYTGSLLEEII